jgi:hypothetical protein
VVTVAARRPESHVPDVTRPERGFPDTTGGEPRERGVANVTSLQPDIT